MCCQSVFPRPITWVIHSARKAPKCAPSFWAWMRTLDEFWRPSKARYLAHPQVAAVFTPAELRRLPLPSGPADEWSLADRFRASFDPERSGDLMVAPKPHITPIIDMSTYVATHGSPWNYDRKVPIL